MIFALDDDKKNVCCLECGRLWVFYFIYSGTNRATRFFFFGSYSNWDFTLNQTSEDVAPFAVYARDKLWFYN